MSVTLRRKRTLPARAATRRAGAGSRVGPVATELRDTAAHQAAVAKEWAAPRLEHAGTAMREWAGPTIASAATRAAPTFEATRDWAAPRVETVVDKAREDVLPKVAAAVTAALAAAEPAADEARVRGTAAVQALKGDLRPAPPPRRHRARRMLLLFAVLSGAYAGWRAWRAIRSEPWSELPGDQAGEGAVAGRESATLTPAPVSEAVVGPTPVTAEPTTPTETAAADAVSAAAAGERSVFRPADAAGASPDEAVADATAEERAAREGPRPDPLEPPLAHGAEQRTKP